MGETSRPPPPPGDEFHPEDANPLGALALLMLSGASAFYCYSLYASGCPCFALYPGIASAFGGFIGFLWEIRGGPLDWLPAVSSLRRANVGAVLGFTAYFVLATSMPWSDGSITFYIFLFRFGIPFFGAWMFMYSWLGQESWRTTIGIPTSILILAAVAAFAPNKQIMDPVAQFLFVAYLLVMMSSFLVAGTVSPKFRSFVFHSGLTVSVILSYMAASRFNFSPDITPGLVPFESCTMFDSPSSVCKESSSFLNFSVLFGIVSGLVMAIKTSNLTFYAFRYQVVSPIWTVLHWFLLSSNGPYPQQAPAGSDGNRNVAFTSYEVAHPNASPLSVPAATYIPLAQRFEYGLLRMIFGITDWGDTNLPVAVIDELPKNKPRMDPRLGIDYYWNSKLLHNPPPHAPPEMKRQFKNGELLSYVLLFSNGFREVREPTAEEEAFVEKATGTRPNRVLDYSKYERFEHRDGFSPYGGKAFLNALNASNEPCLGENEEVHDLVLLGVVGPRDPMHALVGKVGDDGDPTVLPGYAHFDDIQRCIHSSSIFVAVALHHLFEIHTVTSITSIALNNAFDTKSGSVPHAFRALMQVHYYASTEVQEVTTPHLLNHYATFPQIFALKAPEMARAIGDHFNEYEYLADCDFGARSRLMNTPQFRIEQEYIKLYREYAVQCVRICWGQKDNSGDLNEVEAKTITAEINSDDEMTTFLAEIVRQMPSKSIPERFAVGAPGEQKWTADGVVQFIAETVHLHTVRHQYLGTKVALAAMDQSVSGLTAHYADSKPPPAEDFHALILVVAATALKPFPTLVSSDKFNTLAYVEKSYEDYLQVGNHASKAADLIKAFQNLAGTKETGLMRLQETWETDPAIKYSIENDMRVMPNELHVMAGY